MTNRLTTAIAAGALTVGLLTGAAGVIVVDNATADRMIDRHDEQMDATMEMTGGAAMGAMMEMMGGSMMSQPGEMGPESPQHDGHCPSARRMAPITVHP